MGGIGIKSFGFLAPFDSYFQAAHIFVLKITHGILRLFFVVVIHKCVASLLVDSSIVVTLWLIWHFPNLVNSSSRSLALTFLLMLPTNRLIAFIEYNIIQNRLNIIMVLLFILHYEHRAHG